MTLYLHYIVPTIADIIYCSKGAIGCVLSCLVPPLYHNCFGAKLVGHCLYRNIAVSLDERHSWQTDLALRQNLKRIVFYQAELYLCGGVGVCYNLHTVCVFFSFLNYRPLFVFNSKMIIQAKATHSLMCSEYYCSFCWRVENERRVIQADFCGQC